MRVFFALEPDATTTVSIADWRDRQFSPTGNAVPAANFHLTLSFLGEIRPAALENLCLAVDQRLAKSSPQGGSIRLDITGYWPKPGIYWLGAQQPPGQLSRLAELLANLSVAAGGKRERRAFQGHITLFRQCLAPPAAPMAPPQFVLDYQHFTLFESRPGKRGVSYQPLHCWELPPANFDGRSSDPRLG